MNNALEWWKSLTQQQKDNVWQKYKPELKFEDGEYDVEDIWYKEKDIKSREKELIKEIF